MGRSLTEKEIAIRTQWPNVRLIRPNFEYAIAYRKSLEEGFFDWPNITSDWLKDSRNMLSHIAQLNNCVTWRGSEAITLWLVYEDSFLGRVRLKNLSIPLSELKTIDEQIDGNFGYKLTPSWQGKGLGTLLMSLSFDALAERDIKQAMFGISENNKPSLGCANACGAEKIEELYSEKEKIYLFKKELN